jgi:flagellar hook-associated protein 1 FlgK
MGLSVTLANALSGMNSSQSSLEVLSRNVANSGTPGYHRQTVSTVDAMGSSGTYVRSGGVDRAFSQSLQTYYTRSTADAGYANVRASFLDRLQFAFGKPGAEGSLDTSFASLQSALQSLATSPDNYSARATAVAEAQAMAESLNRLSTEVQSLRQDTESRISGHVSSLNQMLKGLEDINLKLADRTVDLGARSAMLDQRDRLVSGLSELVDIRVDYRSDDSVSIMTRSGVGLLDVRASVFSFESGGSLSASNQINSDPSLSGVGKLTIRSASGLVLDAVQQNVFGSGELAGLIELRDKTLGVAQNQLDDIAASLAQALSSIEVPGQAASVGPQQGMDVDLAGLVPGNDLLLGYTENGLAKSVRVVRVEDASKLPMDRVDADGVRVIGLSFAGGAAGVAAGLQAALGTGLTLSGSGSTLRVLDDGVGNTTEVTALSARRTANLLQGDGPAISLFVDSGNTPFTDSLDGLGQRLGFAGRISVNPAVISNNSLLVQYQPGASLGNAGRAELMVERLTGMRFAAGTGQGLNGSGYRISGSIGELVSQVMDHQGAAAASAISARDTQSLALEAVVQRMQSEYGVNVDEEMARLMELQNAYAANARVLSVVQELLDNLMRI